MKEVTYEEWQKNSTPRMMWVWCYDEDNKAQRKVIYVLKVGVYENEKIVAKVQTEEQMNFLLEKLNNKYVKVCST